MDVDKDKFLSDVAKLREAKIITKDKDIVDATGITPGNLSSYLSGSVKPSRNFLDKFYSHYEKHLKKNIGMVSEADMQYIAASEHYKQMWELAEQKITLLERQVQLQNDIIELQKEKKKS